jgi:Trk-type K+ transport system membrane component
MCGQSRIEVGAFAMSANPQAFTFAEPFAGKPIVIITPWYSGTPWAGNNLCISAIATTGFSVRADSIVSMDYIQYVAIGPV